jgi:soluble lytic murein transglycosylase-like protein
MYRASVPVLALALVCGAALPAPAGIVAELAEAPVKAQSAKGYAAMSDSEKAAFIEARARRVSSQLSGGPSMAITPDAVRLIRRELDAYAARLEPNPAKPDRELVRAVVARGQANVPAIRQAFEAEGQAAFTGVYIAMIESAFHDCLESPMGAKGMFQFLPKTAEKYGVAASDLCDLSKSAPAAARYIRDRRGEFGADALGSALALLSYNAGKTNAEAVAKLVAGKTAAQREASFWSVLATPYGRGLPDFVVNESSRYVPSFFAAAIVGENPQDFGLDSQPLSSY